MPLTVAARLWPSPTAQDAKNNGGPSQQSRHTPPLNAAVLWPTPTAGDAKSSGSRNLPGSAAHPGVSLTDAVKYGNSTTPHTRDGGALNPEWVAWLMGFPSEWLSCGDSATPSSRKSSSGSGATS